MRNPQEAEHAANQARERFFRVVYASVLQGIAEVNGGKPYIDADTIPLYGVLASHYIDLQVTDAETLLAKGRAVLEEVKHPRYTYKAKAVDLAKITGLDWHAFDEGKYVHLIDEEKGIDLDAMIIEVGKSDVDGDPLDIDVTISNKSSDVSSAIEDLSRRMPPISMPSNTPITLMPAIQPRCGFMFPMVASRSIKCCFLGELIVLEPMKPVPQPGELPLPQPKAGVGAVKLPMLEEEAKQPVAPEAARR